MQLKTVKVDDVKNCFHLLSLQPGVKSSQLKKELVLLQHVLKTVLRKRIGIGLHSFDRTLNRKMYCNCIQYCRKIQPYPT